MTAQGGVAPFAVELVGAQDERAVDGRALGGVCGEGVGMVKPAVVEVFGGEGALRAVGDADLNAARIQIDTYNFGAHAVDDVGTAVVASGDDAVADGEGSPVR